MSPRSRPRTITTSIRCWNSYGRDEQRTKRRGAGADDDDSSSTSSSGTMITGMVGAIVAVADPSFMQLVSPVVA
jgi:hypothetical protein